MHACLRNREEQPDLRRQIAGPRREARSEEHGEGGPERRRERFAGGSPEEKVPVRCRDQEDGRPHAECTALERKCASLHAIVGNLAMPGFTAPKLTGVARHEPTGYMAMAVVQMVVARSPSWEESS